jgi:glycerol kinase
MRVDGGASMNTLLMQFQADLLDIDIERPSNVETTALGAAYLAGLAVGVFADTAAIAKAHRIDRRFQPAMSAEVREQSLERWRVAVRRARSHA